MTNEEKQIARCRMGFAIEYEEAREIGGGGPSFEELLKLTVEEAIYGLAHNGFRLTANPKWHMDYCATRKDSR